MSDRQPIELEKNHAYPATTLYLDEAIWISAQAPDGNSLSPISGGGGPGFGGWGLDVGRPRGTGGPSRFARDPGMRRVFSEELTTVDKTYEELYASALQQLPAQITAEREAIAKQASEAGPALAKRLELQQRLTTAPVGALSEAAAVGEGAPIPADIADLLRGMEFKTFNGFRPQFWKAMANHPELSKQFDERSLRRMRGQGYAPTVDDSEIHISQISYVLHHTVPISEGGGVYDMNNIRIVTPKLHNSIHYGGDK